MENKNPFFYLADQYYRHRPTYPQNWYHFLSELCDEHELAFDCATGNGQAALGLADYFDRIVATDVSKEQIANAFHMPNVEYRVSPGEVIDLPDNSVDLVTVAQGIHWLNMEKFYLEAKRVMKPGAKIAVWCYNMTEISEALDSLIANFAFETLKPYWPDEVKYVFNNYSDIPFPFTEMKDRGFYIKREWSFDELLNYLNTWSAIGKFWKNEGADPVKEIAPSLREAWGDEDLRLIKWPLHYRLGTLNE